MSTPGGVELEHSSGSAYIKPLVRECSIKRVRESVCRAGVDMSTRPPQKSESYPIDYRTWWAVVQLREYQQDAVIEILGAWADDVQRPAVVLPTGAGKTVIFATLCAMLARRGDRPVVLVARDELVRQTVDKLKNADPMLAIGVIQGPRNELNGEITVASIQTLSRAARLRQVDMNRFNRIICDEAHWAASDSWRRVLEYFGAFDKASGTRVVGFTATMERTDKRGLGEVWDQVVYEKSTRWAIRQGFLVPVRAQTVALPELHLETIKVRNGDLADGDLGRAMAQAKAGPLIAKAYLDLARDDSGELRRGICFAPTIETAEAFMLDFREAGIPTELVIGTTPSGERQAKYAATALGVNRVLMSVGVLTTGFDLPAVEVAVIARPTKSRGLYQQMVGRALRLCPETGKTEALILDVVGASRLGLSTLVDLALDDPEEGELVDSGELDELGNPIMIPHVLPEAPDEVNFKEIDPFDLADVDPHAATRKKIMRRAKQRDQWIMTDGGTPFLAPTETYEYWTFLHHEAQGWSVGRMPKRGKAERVSSALPFPEAMWLAMQGAPVASDLEGAMTEGQERFLDQLRIPRTAETTKADASRLINQRLGSRKLD